MRQTAHGDSGQLGHKWKLKTAEILTDVLNPLSPRQTHNLAPARHGFILMNAAGNSENFDRFPNWEKFINIINISLDWKSF